MNTLPFDRYAEMARSWRAAQGALWAPSPGAAWSSPDLRVTVEVEASYPLSLPGTEQFRILARARLDFLMRPDVQAALGDGCCLRQQAKAPGVWLLQVVAHA